VGTFLTNHDMDRVATELRATDPAALRLAAAALLTLPGTPWLYYGEEIGMKNGRGQGDIRIRTPMRWDATANAGFSSAEPWSGPIDDDGLAPVSAQTQDPESLLTLYRELIALRKGHPALRLGSARPLEASSGGKRPLALHRAREGEEVVVVYNFSRSPEQVRIEDAVLAGKSFKDLRTGEAGRSAGADGVLDLGEVEAYGFRVLSAR
jgi:glycosidase